MLPTYFLSRSLKPTIGPKTTMVELREIQQECQYCNRGQHPNQLIIEHLCGISQYEHISSGFLPVVLNTNLVIEGHSLLHYHILYGFHLLFVCDKQLSLASSYSYRLAGCWSFTSWQHLDHIRTGTDL